jgi:hypothetical protein
MFERGKEQAAREAAKAAAAADAAAREGPRVTPVRGVGGEILNWDKLRPQEKEALGKTRFGGDAQTSARRAREREIGAGAAQRERFGADAQGQRDRFAAMQEEFRGRFAGVAGETVDASQVEDRSEKQILGDLYNLWEAALTDE